MDLPATSWVGESDFPRVLVIDDVREFSFDCAYARTVDQAMRLIGDGWDDVWFDHDLAVGETTRPIVEWICAGIVRGQKPELGQVHVHSSNPAGAERIHDALAPHYHVIVVTGDELRGYLRMRL
jgi:hypothetical protein